LVKVHQVGSGSRDVEVEVPVSIEVDEGKGAAVWLVLGVAPERLFKMGVQTGDCRDLVKALTLGTDTASRSKVYPSDACVFSALSNKVEGDLSSVLNRVPLSIAASDQEVKATTALRWPRPREQDSMEADAAARAQNKRGEPGFKSVFQLPRRELSRRDWT